MYRVEITPRAQRELDAVPQGEFERLASAIESLRQEPRPRSALKLHGPIHRVRSGPWRIIYAIFDRDQLIVIGKVVRRREDTYDALERLF